VHPLCSVADARHPLRRDDGDAGESQKEMSEVSQVWLWSEEAGRLLQVFRLSHNVPEFIKASSFLNDQLIVFIILT
jgi:hypothetical protein